MKLRRALRSCVALVVLIMAPVALHQALAQETNAQESNGQRAVPRQAITDTLRTVEDCLQCHGYGADLSKFGIAPSELHDPAKEIDYRVDEDIYNKSNHSKLACRVCHVIGKEVYPHLQAAKGNYFDCLYCHRKDATDQKFDVVKITADFNESIHVKEVEREFTCYECHNPHVFNITDPGKPIREIIQDDNAICMDCHNDRSKFSHLTDREFPIIEATHRDWLPNTEMHWKSVRCVECHTPHTEVFTHEILPKEESEERCVACHRRDSILLTTLYVHKARQERSTYGFANSVILGENYVIGVTRHPLLDRLSLILLGLTVAGTLGHGLLRMTFNKPRALELIHRVYLYPGWLRVWHWLNAILFIILILTGISMHYADAEQPIISFSLATTIHNIAGLILAGLYLFFIAGNLFTPNGKHYIPNLRGLFQRMIEQIRFYLFGIMRNEPHPFPSTKEDKFNPLQQLAYLAVMYFLMPILIVTGILLQVPEWSRFEILGFGGVGVMAILHSVASFFGTVFLLVHIYLGTTGEKPTTLYKNMITGWHEEFAHEGDAAHPKPTLETHQYGQPSTSKKAAPRDTARGAGPPVAAGGETRPGSASGESGSASDSGESQAASTGGERQHAGTDDPGRRSNAGDAPHRSGADDHDAHEQGHTDPTTESKSGKNRKRTE